MSRLSLALLDKIQSSTVLYDRHGEIQGAFILHDNDVTAVFMEDHNRFVSLETLSRWAKEGRALLRKQKQKKKPAPAAAKKKKGKKK